MPYHCTYEACSDPNRLYGSYQEWLNHESLHTRVWHCQIHGSEFETQPKYIQHLQQDHPEASPEAFSPELVAAAVGPSSKPHRDCPLCPVSFSDLGHMHRHMRYHLEHLALFSLPADPTGGGDDNDDNDGDAPEGSGDSQQAVRGGRQASLDLDFLDSDKSSTASDTPNQKMVPGPSASGPPADPTPFDDIQRHSQESLRPVDLATAVNNWMANVPTRYPSYTSPPPPYKPPKRFPPLPRGWTPVFFEDSKFWICMCFWSWQ